jgi:hypothetical protein
MVRRDAPYKPLPPTTTGAVLLGPQLGKTI